MEISKGNQEQQHTQSLDENYLKAVLFPETSEAARVPTWFSAPSSLFTQRFHYFKQTGPNGNGMICFAPQDTTGRPILQVPDHVDYTSVSARAFCSNTVPSDAITLLQFKGQESSYIPKNYSAVRLVGSSIRVTYIGSDEEESGFMSGGHVYNSTPFEISDEVIEEGHFTSKNVRPKEGVRLVYYPKDPEDINFQSTNLAMGSAHEGGTFVPLTERTVNVGDFFTENDEVNPATGDLSQANAPTSTLSMFAYGTNNSNNQIVYMARQMESHKSPSYYWGQAGQSGDSQNPQMLCVYWRGMKANQNWIRVDVERHFEGIPRPHLRDIVTVGTTENCEHSVDFIQKAAREGILYGHTEDHHKKMVQVVKPNVGVLPFLTQFLKKELELNKTGMASVLQHLTRLVGKKLGKKLKYDVSGVVESGIEIFKQVVDEQRKADDERMIE